MKRLAKMKMCDLDWIAILLIAVCASPCSEAFGQSLSISETMQYLRNGENREWAEFPIEVKEKQLRVEFECHPSSSKYTLSLRQYDVRQDWRILINDQDIGALVLDENDMITYFEIPENTLRESMNVLTIKAADSSPDDIQVGRIVVHKGALNDILTETSIDINIVEVGTGNGLPSRITIINEQGILQTIKATAAGSLAVRPGCVYTSNGKANISLPAGKYKFFGGRGFEYSIDSVRIELRPGDHGNHTLRIRREVETSDWVSSDTHIHTSTFSRHGDCSIEERALTIAGEGIELPIITDHNQNIDINNAAKAVHVDRHFTPVTGNELTTKVGHFNVFKTKPTGPVFNADARDWNDVSHNINDIDKQLAVILNHARDIHNGFRPFDPSHHLSSAGTSVNDWRVPANAMEVINSGSQQSDIMLLYHDWFGMLNHGYYLTPVGSSDSHDVSRFTVGQGRTYIRSNDSDPSKIDVDKAITNFKEGRVLVSLGLLATFNVNGSGPGDFVKASDKVNVDIEVLGPSWADAERVSLYANGVKIKEETITNRGAGGIKWSGRWTLPAPAHDVFLVAIAEGNGSEMPFWAIAKPYQPMSIEWQSRLLASTGAVWIDGDGDGKRSSAYDYARNAFDRSKGDAIKTIKLISSYDEAVAVQAGVLLWRKGSNLNDQKVLKAIELSPLPIQKGFRRITNEINNIK